MFSAAARSCCSQYILAATRSMLDPTGSCYKKLNNCSESYSKTGILLFSKSIGILTAGTLSAHQFISGEILKILLL